MNYYSLMTFFLREHSLKIGNNTNGEHRSFDYQEKKLAL
jgi:hypothetical protein